MYLTICDAIPKYLVFYAFLTGTFACIDPRKKENTAEMYLIPDAIAKRISKGINLLVGKATYLFELFNDLQRVPPCRIKELSCKPQTAVYSVDFV